MNLVTGFILIAPFTLILLIYMFKQSPYFWAGFIFVVSFIAFIVGMFTLLFILMVGRTI